MARGWHLVWMISCVHLVCFSNQQRTGFLYNNFDRADLYLDEAAQILPGGLLKLTNATELQMGHAFFKQPFMSDSSQSFSFSTHFVCALVPPKPGVEGGHGVAFVVSPSLDLTNADPTQFLGLLNTSTNGSPSSHLFAIELDTVQTAEFDDIDNNHIGIDVNSLKSVESASASYFSNTEGKNKSLRLLSGDPIQVWVDYEANILNVSLAPLQSQKPSQPLLSRSINLSEVFSDRMFVGFSGATGTLNSYQYILGWSFSRSSASLQGLDISKLPQIPLPKPENKKSSVLLIVLFLLLAIIVLAVLGGAYLYMRSKYGEIVDEWDKQYGPLRFSYKSLYKATKGFHEDELIGKGGFGEVYRGALPLSYKGTLPSSYEKTSPANRKIAVKRVSHNSDKGMKQFVAEIMSMRSLAHKNLVALLGYCRRKGELLLVYEYMHNGSLDHYLFDDKEQGLSWSQRLVIIKDVSSALEYLHKGATKVVLHRDIKASNVMLDSDYNGKLGDFGMSRLHDHGSNPAPTAAVGTLGYMAPELVRTGASTETDVYAFGVFLLEVTCGRRPVELEMPVEQRYLVNWVCECWKRNSLLDAVDPRLGREFRSEEVEMVLKLGLLCAHALPESRPTMEQVVQFLNMNMQLPDFSPYTPGIGAFSLVVSLEASGSASESLPQPSASPSAPNSDMYVTHTIMYGEGR